MPLRSGFQYHNSASGDIAFQGLTPSLAALSSPMNRQLFVFVQLTSGFFKTVYHGEGLHTIKCHIIGSHKYDF